MQAFPSKTFFSELQRAAFWQLDPARTPMEHLLDYLLTGSLAANAPRGIMGLAEKVLQFDLRKTRVVLLGGGTGLSTVVGGNSQMADWADHPWAGIKQEFPHLHTVVCTTDDGGSTGQLLKSFPIIGVGDLRKIILSSILSENLQQIYGINERATLDLVRLIHSIFNFRFPADASSFQCVRNPLLTIFPALRAACPKRLAEGLRSLGIYVSPRGSGPTILPGGHALGNILLTSAILMSTKGTVSTPPGLRDIQKGIDHIAGLIGAPAGRIHAATSTPGQLKICYANGVEVYGQSKSARSHRNSPVDRVFAEFIHKPAVSASILQAILKADLIVFAPGSLYTSIIPLLQLEPILDAVRANRRALKVLAANSWVQEGETDISLKNQGRGFLVSELIEACDRNVPGGIDGLFDVVLSPNLEHVSGNILRNYALEGKSPIHLDKKQVEALGIQPVEATLFSPEYELKTKAIYHDARKFSLAIRTLLYADRFLREKRGYAPKRRQIQPKSVAKGTRAWGRNPSPLHRGILLCDYLRSIHAELKNRQFQPAGMRDLLLELVWENRDIRPSHLKYFRGVKVIPAQRWNRSTELDNILGYYDPTDRYLKLHEDLLKNPARLREDFLVALGESLLGQYIEKRQWIRQNGARCYEIFLRAPEHRECFLSEAQLESYLQLARMTPDPNDRRIYRITINNDGGFLPPGLLFGMLYSWYLCGSGFTMEYEMTLLRWPLKSLIPLHVRDRVRKKALVTFFRTVIFGHPK
jgi:uncharacterized cofD-like protein